MAWRNIQRSPAGRKRRSPAGAEKRPGRVFCFLPPWSCRPTGEVHVLIPQAGVGHELHYLDVTDEECKRRLRARHAAGGHPFTLDDAQFDAMTRHFVPPADEEGFRLVRHG
ncbi:AAA family ATPase [Microvirgula aerodenitrificans]|uniref:AAA family ATPase n=1 Tax=Microvirgula aerodenitrificans TaxID=57480 RepID=UPI000A061DA3